MASQNNFGTGSNAQPSGSFPTMTVFKEGGSVNAWETVRPMESRSPGPETPIDLLWRHSHPLDRTTLDGPATTFYLKFDLQKIRDMLGPNNPRIQSEFSALCEKHPCCTGTWLNAQLTTVTKYMEQTWPGGTWKPIIYLLEELICSKGENQVTCTAPWPHTEPNDDGTPMELNAEEPKYLHAVKISESILSVTVMGTASVANAIGRQLGLLAATFRPSQADNPLSGLYSLTPTITNVRKIPGASCWECDIVFEHDYHFEPTEDRVASRASMLKYVCLVEGYPIRPRPIPVTGLEICWEFFGLKLGYELENRGRDLTLTKGSSRALIVKVSSGVVVWRHIGHVDPERAKMLDPELACMTEEYQDVRIETIMEAKRHIISASSSSDGTSSGRSSCTLRSGMSEVLRYLIQG